jgi:hypothetical protein
MSTEILKPRRAHPALRRHGEERARSIQIRIADTIAGYAGSMGQNRIDEKRAVLASAAWDSVKREEKQNEKLIADSAPDPEPDRRDPPGDRSSVGGTYAYQGARS